MVGDVGADGLEHPGVLEIDLGVEQIRESDIGGLISFSCNPPFTISTLTYKNEEWSIKERSH